MKRTLILGERDLERCEKEITDSIKRTVKDSASEGVVLGLSGGVDSSLVLALAARCDLDVLGLIMPEEGMTTQADIRDAKALAESLNVTCEVIAINPVLDAIDKAFPWKEFPVDRKKTALGNCKARVRMVYNYMAANLGNRIVLGTGNRTEILLGYATKYGDGGVDVLPIGDLYKTQVRELASFLDVPKRIVEKVPTAGLWKGQTDEGEIGASYDEMDNVLYCLADRKMTVEATAKELGLSVQLVKNLSDRMRRNAHKRCVPPVTGLFD